MRRTILALILILSAALPVRADITYFGQVPLLPPPEGEQPDIDALAAAAWPAYWRAAGAHGFTRSDLRLGRFDLDGDGIAELFLMIDSSAWANEHGKPMLVARWAKNGWLPVGWGWADEDRVFAGFEREQGWRSLDIGTHLMHWDGKQYQNVVKN